jgi:hypothetical protein
MNDSNALKCNSTSVWGIIKSRKKVVKHILKETQKIKIFCSNLNFHNNLLAVKKFFLSQ